MTAMPTYNPFLESATSRNRVYLSAQSELNCYSRYRSQRSDARSMRQNILAPSARLHAHMKEITMQEPRQSPDAIVNMRSMTELFFEELLLHYYRHCIDRFCHTWRFLSLMPTESAISGRLLPVRESVERA
jgi:hypothetical protein